MTTQTARPGDCAGSGQQPGSVWTNSRREGTCPVCATWHQLIGLDRRVPPHWPNTPTA